MRDTKIAMDNNVFIASDHNGTACRNYVIKRLREMKYEVVDLGPSEYDGKVDYPDYAVKLCKEVLDKNCFGILICGTGTGMLIAANRFSKIRAGLATDRATAELMREHNNCNVLVLGQWRTPLAEMDAIVESFLKTKFENGRHIARVNKLRDFGSEL